MKTNNISLTKMTLWQTVGRFLLQGISFFTVPIFTRILSPSDYDYIAIYSTWINLFSLIVGLQTSGSIANAIRKYDEKEIDAYFSSIMTISFLSFIVVLVCSFVFINPLSTFFEFTPKIVFLMILQSFTSFCVGFYQAILEQYKQVQKSVVISIVISLTTVALSLLFVFMAEKQKYLAKIVGGAIPTVIAGIIILFMIFIRGKTFYNKAYYKFCLALCLPLILHGIGGLVMSQSDKVMLKKMAAEGETGIYSMSYTLAFIIETIWYSFNHSWGPFYYDYKKSGQIERLRKDANGYLFTFTVITMGFICCAPEVFKLLVPESYWSGLNIVPLVALAYYMNFLYSFPANHEFYNEKTVIISIGTICAMGVNIALNFVFIPLWGGLGAAIATLISHFMMMFFHDIAARFFVKKYEFSPLFYLKGIVPVVGFVVLYYVSLSLPLIRWGIAVVLGTILVVRFYKRRSIF